MSDRFAATTLWSVEVCGRIVRDPVGNTHTCLRRADHEGPHHCPTCDLSWQPVAPQETNR